MQTPPPDPVRDPANTSAEGLPAPGSGSQVKAQLSEALKSHSSATRATSAAEVIAQLSLPVSSDDAPTVITQPGKSSTTTPPPPPPHVVGDSHSIAGRRLGHFELIEAIGAGGMAAVLKARDLELGRIVALKILPPESALDPENVSRFKQEARAAAKLDHDNVARVYYCGEDQGLHFIAFEFVEGITLRQAIDWRGPVPPGDCVRYMIQVAAGLAHASERGVVHRDIKPSNILITPEGKAKIVDMGLARHLEPGSVNGGVTQSGVTLGTFDYISPEQALDPREADVRSDIYSLGCAFYHALTGRPPVPDGTAAKKLHAHQYIDPLDPREINSKIPDELAAVLARMMAKDPSRRYQSPADLIANLKAVAEKLRIPLDAVASDSTVKAVRADDRVLPGLPRFRTSWVVAGAALVAACVAVVFAVTGPDFGSSLPGWANLGPAKPEPVPDPGPQPKPGPAPNERIATTAEGLAAALADPKTTRIKLAGAEFDLSRLEKPIAFHGPHIELIGSVNQPVVVRVLPPASRRSDTNGSLTLTSGFVKIEGVRFEIAPPPAVFEQTGDLTGLAILDSTRVEFTDCLFVPDAEAKQAGVAAVSIGTATGETARVLLTRCLFAPGAVGLRVPSRSNVEVLDSGFAPHTSAIQIRDDSATPDESSAGSAIRFEQSSFMLDAFSAAVDVDASATQDVRVSSGHCVFAPVSGPAPEPKAPGVLDPPPLGSIIRNSARKRSAKLVALAEKRNAYYQVTPLTPSAKGTGFEEPGWVKLDRRPWEAGSGVLTVLTTDEPWPAFRLTLSGAGADPAVFIPRSELGVLGAQFHDPNRGSLRRAYGTYSGLWPPSPPAVAELTTRIWWPKAPVEESQLPPGTYSNLAKLFEDARSGDTILIRHTGILELERQYQIQPRKGTTDRSAYHLTFRPETRDHHPILVSPTEATERELSMFVVKEGRVTFENLHFELRPGGSQNQLAGVTLVAGRECSFRNCTFTLDEHDGKIATVVTLADSSKVMKMDGPGMASAPRIEFEGCLIRGKGRALAVSSSRPFNLDMENTITGLDGPVIFANNAGRDLGGGNGSAIRLSRVTALLGGPFIELHGGAFGVMKSSGLVQTTISSDRCLFAAVPGAATPMVEVEGTDFDRSDPNRVLKWETREPSRFVNFGTTAPVIVKSEAGGTQEWMWREWIEFARELSAGRTVGKVAFADEPDNQKDLSKLKPADVRVKSVDLPDLPDAKPSDAGADTEKVALPPEANKADSPDEP